MPLTIFELHEQFMIGRFLIKLTLFEKTGSIGIFFISLGNLKKQIPFSMLEIDHVCFYFLTFAVRQRSLPSS